MFNQRNEGPIRDPRFFSAEVRILSIGKAKTVTTAGLDRNTMNFWRILDEIETRCDQR